VRRVPTEQEREAQRRANAERSWALAEMYPVNILPPYEVQVAFVAKYEEARETIRSMQAAGVPYDVARRTLIGLPPYPPKNDGPWITPNSPRAPYCTLCSFDGHTYKDCPDRF
jgi:hypothetical protein